MHEGLLRHGRFLMAALWLVGALLDARAAEVSKGDAQKVREVIQAQLAAFAADDAERAFSYAAPAIREQFGSPERFIAMVRQGYPVVFRPASVTFLRPDWVDGQLLQAVQMTDAAGAMWLAVYHLQRQPDRSWRISGCEVVQNEGRAT